MSIMSIMNRHTYENKIILKKRKNKKEINFKTKKKIENSFSNDRTRKIER